MSDPVLQGLIRGIERLAQTKVAAHRLPGMALGIVRDQELAWFGGFGAADLDSGAKAHRRDDRPRRFGDQDLHGHRHHAVAGPGAAHAWRTRWRGTFPSSPRPAPSAATWKA